MRFASIGFRLPREAQTCSMVCRVALFGNPILLAAECRHSLLLIAGPTYEERDNMMTHLRVEPLFDNLRSEPRFKELLRRMHLD